MVAVYIAIGIFIGVIALFAIAALMSKRDNNKFDPEKPIANQPPVGWPETQTWSSTKVEVQYVHKTPSPKEKEKGKNEKSLEDQLQEALDKEEYLVAAKIRDEINKNKNKK